MLTPSYRQGSAVYAHSGSAVIGDYDNGRIFEPLRTSGAVLTKQNALAAMPLGAAAFSVQNDWSTGFTGQVTVTNQSSVATNGWAVEIDTPDLITAAWNSSIVSQSAGKYFISNAAWNGSLAPGASVTFGFNANRAPGASPVSVLLTSIGSATVRPPPPPLPTLVISNAAVNEGVAGAHLASFDVRLSAASTQAVTLNYAMANGTALAGRDYDAAAGTLTFAPGQTDQAITVATHPGMAGTNLLFALAVSGVHGATAPAASASGAITNPAAVVTPPTSALVVNVSEDAYLGDAQFTVTVDGVPEGGVFTSTASHGAGQTAALAIPGTFGAGRHSVAVTFLNDAYGGPGKDRNLYVDSVTYNGTKQTMGAGLYTSNATTTVSVGSPAPSTGFKYLGVNLSGAEFGIPNPTNGTVYIGTYGSTYTNP